jgi:hypothetical protein
MIGGMSLSKVAQMDQAKTKPQDTDIETFLSQVLPERQAEARALLQIFNEVTGFSARIWAGRMVGFGRYEYRYATGHSGQALASGFAMGRAEISVYIMPGYADFGHILKDLGKHRLGKSCLYLRRLSDANRDALRALIRAGLDDLAQHWPVFPV